MRIALIDTTPKSKIYPLGLLKIGAWRKTLGDECELFANELPPAGTFDEIWITTTFTFDIQHALGIVREAVKRCSKVKVGGISATLFPDKYRAEGVEVHEGLLQEAEHYTPDYSLLKTDPEYSIIHTSRGCVRRCGFCMVTKLEPDFYSKPNWVKDLHPKTKRVLFYDNNWLAKPIEEIKADADVMRQLVKEKRVSSFDFNQALDSRLLTDEQADLIEGLPITPMRFAFDGMHEDKLFQSAVEKMAKRGYREFVNLVLYNFNDTPKDLYYRLSECVRLSADLGVACKAFPMRYQPIMDLDNQREFTGRHWTKKTRASFMYIVSKHSGGSGTVSCHQGDTMSAKEEFQYWFGKDADEFVRLLNYPKLTTLCERKNGALRMKRAIEKRDIKNAKKEPVL